ncbi:PREDICTED: uncharacterized protein LOC109158091 [Ipomoea nil]|uniref:uncharacterized protein LOC109158091 n=1 Tax=Ipomoea nil TaxID=35883 RepID=UPI000900B137|nr:PREDICTED: uncharacterized protein LOC109158091 [Ipomoea nil]
MAVWELALPTPLHICHAFQSTWAAWNSSNARRHTASPPLAAPLPPAFADRSHAVPVDAVVCNTDAGFYGSDYSPTYGFYVRSMEGAFVAATNGPLLCPYDPLLAEAMAIREALSWLQEHNYHNVEIFSDYAVLVSSFRDASSFRLYLGVVLDSCLRLIRSFASCSIKFVRRDTNSVAHALAKHVSVVEARTVWRDTLPSFIVTTMN